MREYVLATESNADLSEEFIRANDICVIPHYYAIENEEYGGDRELPIHEFYDALREKKKAKTMASNPAVIYERFSEIAKAGKDILFVSFSSALSGGINNIRMGGETIMEENPGCRVVVVDSLSAITGEEILIRAALDAKAEGKTIDEAAAILEDIVPHICVQFTVDDLFHLQRGGRVGFAAAAAGTVISLKPILYFNEKGELVSLEMVRGRKKSIHTLVKNMEARIGSYNDESKQPVIGVLHGDCEEEALVLKGLIEEKFGFTNIDVKQIGPSIGVHSGPGTLGIIFLGDRK